MHFAKNWTDDVAKAMLPSYLKILIVNLSKDTYKPIVVADDEWGKLRQNKTYKISQYWTWFAQSEFLHPDDRKQFINFAMFADVGKHVIYRRKFGNVWRLVILNIVATLNYDENNKECMLYVKDIDEIYNKEYEQVIDKIGTTDAATGLHNKLGFERDCTRYQGKNVGFVYADLNGLKHVNDTKGHAAGDEYIKTFAAMLSAHFAKYTVYHLSGDEFLVAAFNCSVRQFAADARAFQQNIWQTQPIAATGFAVGDADELQLVLRDAEALMYDDKQKYYNEFPDMARK